MLTPCSAKIWFSAVSTPGRFSWICSRRRPPCSGSDTSGKFTADSVEPLSEYLISLPATSRPIFSCASWVEPPMCGVRITLSNSHSGEVNGSLLVAGSVGKTSMAAPARCLRASASHSAGMSTTVPRAALISSEPGFISASSSAPIMFLVEAFSGTCRLTTSLMFNRSERCCTWVALPNGNLLSIS